VFTHKIRQYSTTLLQVSRSIICQMAASRLEHTRVGYPHSRYNIQGKSNFPILWPCLSENLVKLDIF